MASDWDRAWSALEEARTIVAELGKAADAYLHRAVGSAGCHLELAVGLPDQALQTLDAQPRATDPEARYSDLLDSAAIAMSLLSPRYMETVEEKIEAALATTEELPLRPGVEATLRARLALIALQREEIERPTEFEAEIGVKAAFENESLDPTTRTSLALRGAARALALDDLERAASWLARADTLAGGAASQTELREASIAYHAQLARRRGASEEDLARHAEAVSKAWNALLERLSGAPQRRGGLGWLAWRNRRAVYGAQVELSLAIGEHGAERAIEVGMREEEIGSLAQRMSAAGEDLSGDLAAARELLLRPRVGLLVYLPGDEGILRVFLVRREGPVLVDSVRWRFDLEQRPRDLTMHLSRSPADLEPTEASASRQAIDVLAKDLGSSLLPAAIAEQLVHLDEVYVVGSGLLGDVPFDHLWLGDGPIGLQLGVSHLPSLRVGMALARRARKASVSASNLLLVTAPEIHASLRGHLASFELSPSDGKRLTSGFEKSVVLTSKAASLSGVLAAMQRRAPTFLHLMVHGANDFRRELTGGLVLAPEGGSDGRVWCDDLLASEFRSPPLIALSACHSARGPRRVGDDGLAQLGGVLFLRGARCVVEATSDIALDPTVDLMETFGRAVAKGESPARAMLEARQELVGAKTYAHPFYALSLRVVGLGNEPVVRAARGK